MIAVTGATGNLGRLIIEQLLARVDAGQVVAVARSPEKADDLAARGVAVRYGDYEDVESLVAAFGGVDVLMFISGTAIGQRMRQHKNVVDAAKQAGVSRIVYTSAMSAEGENIIVQEHRATEGYLEESGLAHTILRPNLYMDMYVIEVKIAIEKGVYRSAVGEGAVSFIRRYDIARAAAAVLLGEGHAGKVYELTGPTAVTAPDFARVASAISGKEIAYEPITLGQLAEDFQQRGMSPEVVQMAVGLQMIVATNSWARVTTHVADLTGTPATGFDEFVRKALA